MEEEKENKICNEKIKCFSSLTHEEVELVKNSRTRIFYHKGETLAKQGAYSSYILYVIDGVAKEFIEGDKNRITNFKITTTGEFIGLSAAFNSSVLNYSAIALTEMEVCLMEKNAITEIIKSNGSFAFNIVQRYSEHEAELYLILKNLLYKQMNGRIADVLLYLSSDKFKNFEIFSLLTRKDIADFANVSTENTVKILKSFEKDSIIELSDKNINIINKSHLITISKKG